MQYSAVYNSTVQKSIAQSWVVQLCTVQCVYRIEAHCSEIQCRKWRAVNSTLLNYTAMKCSALMYSILLCSVQCSVVLCSSVQCSLVAFPLVQCSEV